MAVMPEKLPASSPYDKFAEWAGGWRVHRARTATPTPLPPSHALRAHGRGVSLGGLRPSLALFQRQFSDSSQLLAQCMLRAASSGARWRALRHAEKNIPKKYCIPAEEE